MSLVSVPIRHLVHIYFAAANVDWPSIIASLSSSLLTKDADHYHLAAD